MNIVDTTGFCELCNRAIVKTRVFQKYCEPCKIAIHRAKAILPRKLLIETNEVYREKAREHSRIWRKRHKEVVKQQWKDWIAKNYERYKELNRIKAKKHREKLKQIVIKYSPYEWSLKLQSTNGICPRCNKYVGIENLTLDHIIPISKAPIGFVYTINDIQPLCSLCNTIKGNRL